LRNLSPAVVLRQGGDLLRRPIIRREWREKERGVMEPPVGFGGTDELERALAEPGLVVLLGAVDTGKTTFALHAANTALARGLKVGVIDADVGQSEIGPPGTVGLALPQSPAASAADWRPAALAFVGATSPPGRLLDVVVGTRRMVDEARHRGAELVIVDTSGLVHGAAALKLKLAKLELLQPTTILALRRGRELDPMLRLAPAVCSMSATSRAVIGTRGWSFLSERA